eukprot:CAMPEP_0174233726 /NCGR_PEP_ID=MMETSP0417-20130205/3693_1 /TAXON_ID=242541 /ORGANISM="Mayorella sp, Strain BSH-02190019" /LENGTH=942 /DNA_ID=CAMNT_0015311989 /DNA_START=155 /DNA_END=2980 /DNA_ORIENTATION=+
MMRGKRAGVAARLGALLLIELCVGLILVAVLSHHQQQVEAAPAVPRARNQPQRQQVQQPQQPQQRGDTPSHPNRAKSRSQNSPTSTPKASAARLQQQQRQSRQARNAQAPEEVAAAAAKPPLTEAQHEVIRAKLRAQEEREKAKLQQRQQNSFHAPTQHTRGSSVAGAHAQAQPPLSDAVAELAERERQILLRREQEEQRELMQRRRRHLQEELEDARTSEQTRAHSSVYTTDSDSDSDSEEEEEERGELRVRQRELERRLLAERNEKLLHEQQLAEQRRITERIEQMDRLRSTQAQAHAQAEAEEARQHRHTRYQVLEDEGFDGFRTRYGSARGEADDDDDDHEEEEEYVALHVRQRTGAGRAGERFASQEQEEVDDLFLEDMQRRSELSEPFLSQGERLLFGINDTELNFTKAYENFEMAATYGSPTAQGYMAFMLDNGKGVPVNHAQALLYYSFAAAGGDLFAIQVLGNKYRVGDGVAADCHVAVDYFSQASTAVIEDESSVTQLPEPTPRLAHEYLTGRNIEEEEEDVIEYYRYHAGAGDPQAQGVIGQLYYQGGHGVEQDFELAHHYLGQAAQAGNAEAMGHLAVLHAQGLGVEQDNATAVKLYQQAIEKAESPLALTNLGIMHLEGQGVPKDPAKAFQLIERAAKKNNIDGQYNLAVLYYNGWGTPLNLKKARELFTKAGSQGHVVAIYHLAYMHLYGMAGVSASCPAALRLMKRVAERGQMSDLMYDAHDSYTDGFVDDALIRYEMASEMGFEIAQSNAAWLYDMMGDTLSTEHFAPLMHAFRRTHPEATEEEALLYARRTRALRFLYAASQQHSVEAHLRLGDYYYYGYGPLKVDHVIAASYYRRASEMRNAQATFNLGYMHEHGEGLAKDFFLAKRYYDQSAAMNPDATVPVQLMLIAWLAHYIYEKGVPFEWILEADWGLSAARLPEWTPPA